MLAVLRAGLDVATYLLARRLIGPWCALLPFGLALVAHGSFHKSFLVVAQVLCLAAVALTAASGGRRAWWPPALCAPRRGCSGYDVGVFGVGRVPWWCCCSPPRVVPCEPRRSRSALRRSAACWCWCRSRRCCSREGSTCRGGGDHVRNASRAGTHPPVIPRDRRRTARAQLQAADHPRLDRARVDAAVPGAASRSPASAGDRASWPSWPASRCSA